MLNIFGLSAFGCKKAPDDSGKQPTVEIPVGKQFVSHFDKYEDLCLWTFPYSDILYEDKDWWSTYHTAKLNKDKEYLTEGVGSMYLKTDYEKKTTNYLYKILKTHHDNPARGTLTDSIYGAQSISFDVYNCTAYTIKATMKVSTITTTVIDFSVNCKPNQWTTVSAPITEEITATIDNYRLELTNLNGAKNFDVYIDNFYLQFPEK